MYLAKRILEIGWKNGNTLIRYSDNPDALRMVLSEGLHQAMNLYADTNLEATALMMQSILEDYEAEPVSIIVDSIKELASGKRKIYGRVTPNDIREIIKEKLELLAVEREQRHEARLKTAYIPRGKETSMRDWIKGQKRK